MRRSRIRIIALIFATLFIAGISPPNSRSDGLDTVPIAFETVAQGAFSFYRYGEPDAASSTMVIRNSEAWQWFWRKHSGGMRLEEQKPRIDFREEIVIAAIAGYRTTAGGNRIEIAEIEFDLECNCLKVRVEVENRDGPLPMIANPYHIVKIARANYRSIIIEYKQREL